MGCGSSSSPVVSIAIEEKASRCSHHRRGQVHSHHHHHQQPQNQQRRGAISTGLLLNAARMSFDFGTWPSRKREAPQSVPWAVVEANTVVTQLGKHEKGVVGEEECPLCLETYLAGDDTRTLPCRHFFHSSCVDAWLTRSHLCPMCCQSISNPPPNPLPNELDR